jgi:hypothetical protein
LRKQTCGGGQGNEKAAHQTYLGPHNFCTVRYIGK